MAIFVEQKLTPSYLKTLVSFLTILHSGQLGWDGQYFFTADKTGLGVQNTQRLGDQIDKTKTNEEATLQDIVNAWNALRQAGQLVYMQNPPAVEQPAPPTQPTQPGEMDIVAKEIALQAKQRREAGIPGVRNYAKDDTRINGDAILAEKALQLAKNNADFQAFQNDLNFAQNYNPSGRVSITELNSLREREIAKVQQKWIARRPDLREQILQKIGQPNTVGSAGFVPLRIDASVQEMKNATPQQLRELTRRRRDAQAAERGEPNHDAW